MTAPFSTPPSAQDRPRDDPENHRFLVIDTAMAILNMNFPYTGKSLEGEHFQRAFQVHVLGIKNALSRGTAVVEDGTILFWHPGRGEYVKYDLEYQVYLLQFLRETKALLASL